MEKIFIDKNIKIFKGVEAEKLIKEKNDSKYIQDNSILSVDIERWREAQEYEKKTWMVLCRNNSDDRNYEHFSRFDSYQSLVDYQKNNKIKKVIELGCGPFTNIRTILNLLPDLEEIDLLDPLLDDYLTHPNCFYKNKEILNFKVTTHSTPIENFKLESKYDLVIMNNVLEHCYDINNIFNKITEMLNQNGLFVFSDVYFTGEDVKKLVHDIYDTGHPLKLSDKSMLDFISKFQPLYEKDFHKLYGQDWRHDKYFIGFKK